MDAPSASAMAGRSDANALRAAARTRTASARVSGGTGAAAAPRAARPLAAPKAPPTPTICASPGARATCRRKSANKSAIAAPSLHSQVRQTGLRQRQYCGEPAVVAAAKQSMRSHTAALPPRTQYQPQCRARCRWGASWLRHKRRRVSATRHKHRSRNGRCTYEWPFVWGLLWLWGSPRLRHTTSQSDH